MIMKTWILITAATLILTCLVWISFVKQNFSAQSTVGGQSKSTADPRASPTTFEDFKVLFFADQSLEEIAKPVDSTRPAAKDVPWALFASALAKSRQGKGGEAKKDLYQVLAAPDGESRIRLWAWKALRELGERPHADVADEVQGVVCELHNEAGVGTIAAYADGRVRWLGGQGKLTVWEVPGSDAELSALISKLLESAKPLVKSTPASDTHKVAEVKLNYFRVSILTYGGIHIADVFGPEIHEKHPIGPVFIGSVNLLDALSKKSDDAERKSGPR